MKFFFCLVFFLFFFNLPADSGETERRIYTALKSNPHPPVIDGIIDDPIWQKACCGDSFVQVEPHEGISPTERTNFKMCYDNKNLYVLIVAYDRTPTQIMSMMARRDDIHHCDLAGIVLDTYYDKRTAFEFTVNPAGIKYDAVYANDERHHADASWDPVWEVATNVTDSGWVAEMRIPFNQLRFAEQEEQVWGLEVYRYIHRNQESSLWQFIPQNAAGFVSHFGELRGIKGISVPKRVEILPYGVSKYNHYEPEEGNPFTPGQSASAAAGLDAKIGLSSDLTMDLTLNPDFGQVEADPSEVNLSAFETFFDEKRPFFIEGKNIFQFPLGIGDGDFARETLFYSRRIGRTPQHEPDLPDDIYISSPEQTSILGAAKISGKTASGWSIGVMDALTAEEKAKIDSQGVQRKETVEPFTNYFIGRFQKDINHGNTALGGMVTATNRNINQVYLNYINRSAYTGGIDILHQWSGKTYFFDLKLSGSHIAGHKDAILEVQTASARYFQRPDASHLTLDSSRTSLSGHGGSINIGKQGNAKWRYILGGVWRSPGFELNDVGYLQQADQAMQFIWMGYQNLNPVGIFRNMNLNINQWNGWNFGGEKMFAGGNINGGGQFKNYWGFWLGINRQEPGLSSWILRGGPTARYEGSWNTFYNFYSDSRRFWQIAVMGSNYINDDDITRRHEIWFELFLKPSARLNISLGPFYSRNLENLQYVDTYDNRGEDRYIMAKLNQNTIGMILRLNYSLTPELSVQFYGQPFISAGEYAQFKRVTNARAENYSDRFHTFSEDEISYDSEDQEYLVDENRDGSIDYRIGLPDFNFKQFRSNLVVRWEYRPGSLVYLVWSQDRTVEDEYGDFSYRRDLRNLFGSIADNIFLVKFSYWFSL
ncbi:MAG: carbohydrate binding family 9 domain-containing protein [bacterium]|nr:MAG: carbohydrate binding family 9 domain-containing protein [bacterium]